MALTLVPLLIDAGILTPRRRSSFATPTWLSRKRAGCRGRTRTPPTPRSWLPLEDQGGPAHWW